MLARLTSDKPANIGYLVGWLAAVLAAVSAVVGLLVSMLSGTPTNRLGPRSQR